MSSLRGLFWIAVFVVAAASWGLIVGYCVGHRRGCEWERKSERIHLRS